MSYDFQLRLESTAHAIASLLDSEDQVREIAWIISETFLNGGKLLVFGNGGSAADAQHFVGEFVGKLSTPRQPFPALALGSSFSVASAISNDFGYESVFSRELKALGNPRDCAIGISTSGRSPNVLGGLKEAQTLGMKTVGIFGSFSPPELQLSVTLNVDSTNTQVVQEVHTLALHVICEIWEDLIA